MGSQPYGVVVHTILSPTAGKSEIPSLLRGDGPPVEDAQNLGTKDDIVTCRSIGLAAIRICSMKLCGNFSEAFWGRRVVKPAKPNTECAKRVLIQSRRHESFECNYARAHLKFYAFDGTR